MTEVDCVANEIRKTLTLDPDQPLRQRLYLAFKRPIVLGNIKAGSVFPETKLAEALSMSRTPLRYAIDRLIDEQLLERRRGLGVKVLGIDSDAANEIFDIRAELETTATVEAMNNMSHGDYSFIGELLTRSVEMNSYHQVSELISELTLFNQLILTFSGMPHLRAIVTDISAYLAYFRDANLMHQERRSNALDEHWTIFHAMTSGNAQRVSDAVHEHLWSSRTEIIYELNHQRLMSDEEIQHQLKQPWMC